MPKKWPANTFPLLPISSYDQNHYSSPRTTISYQMPLPNTTSSPKAKVKKTLISAISCLLRRDPPQNRRGPLINHAFQPKQSVEVDNNMESQTNPSKMRPFFSNKNTKFRTKLGRKRNPNSTNPAFPESHQINSKS